MSIAQRISNPLRFKIVTRSRFSRPSAPCPCTRQPRPPHPPPAPRATLWRLARPRLKNLKADAMRELALFAGAGGGLLSSKLLGFQHVGYVECDDYCQRVIAARIRDGLLDDAPIFGDIRAFIREGYAASYQGLVDVVSGGFPCQDISTAGKHARSRRCAQRLVAGNGPRHSLVRPRFAWVENAPVITACGLWRVLGDFAEMGMDARWGVFSAGDAGARHERARCFVLAYRDGELESPRPWSEQQFRQAPNEPFCDGLDLGDSRALWLAMASTRAGMDADVAHWVERAHAVGNGQVPCVAATAWRMLT